MYFPAKSNKGNYDHNVEGLKTNMVKQIVSLKRQSEACSPSDFIPCTYIVFVAY
jgi:hypothetical protein